MQSNPYVAAGGEPPSEAQSPVVARDNGVPSPVGALRISSQALFAGANEVEIEHKGALYRLRQTSLGKLILTK